MSFDSRGCSGLGAAVLSLSASGADLGLASIAYGRASLQQIGLSVKLDECYAVANSYKAGDGAFRTNRLIQTFNDESIDLIFSVYGGYNAIDMLPYLDSRPFLNFSKPIVGFSDITTILAGLYSIGVQNLFHGPNFGSLCEPNVHWWTIESLRAALFERSVVLIDPGTVADEPWFKRPNQPRNWRANRWRAIRGGVVYGRLLGGNLPSLLALAGTPYFPDLSDAILLLEVNTNTPPGEVDRGFRQLQLMGELQKVKGLIFGAGDQLIEASIDEVVNGYAHLFVGPIMTGVNCGHVDPIATLPYGSFVTLDCGRLAISYRQTPPLTFTNIQA